MNKIYNFRNIKDYNIAGVFTGNPHNDTECKECENGTFSSTESYKNCTPCTKCEIYKTPCSPQRDAECQTDWTNTSMKIYQRYLYTSFQPVFNPFHPIISMQTITILVSSWQMFLLTGVWFHRL